MLLDYYAFMFNCNWDNGTAAQHNFFINCGASIVHGTPAVNAKHAAAPCLNMNFGTHGLVLAIVLALQCR